MAIVLVFLKLVASTALLAFNIYSATYLYHEKSGFKKAGVVLAAFLTLYLLAWAASKALVPEILFAVLAFSLMHLIGTVIMARAFESSPMKDKFYVINNPKFSKAGLRFELLVLTRFFPIVLSLAQALIIYNVV